MNWYKQARTQPTLQFLSHDNYGDFKVLVNGEPYTYYDVSPHIANKLKWMINKPNIPNGVIINKLKNFSDPKRHKELNP